MDTFFHDIMQVISLPETEMLAERILESSLEAPPTDKGSEALGRPAETPEAPKTTIEPEAKPSEETAPRAAEETTSPQQ